MGHCVSYDEMRAVNTSIAEEVLAKIEEFGTLIPTNIKPGAFFQIAANNNDLNEKALEICRPRGKHSGNTASSRLEDLLRLPCTFRGVFSLTHVALLSFAADTPNPISN